MPPKNKQKNSFYFFMKEMKENLERQGTRMKMSDVPGVAHPKWKRLSAVEKEKYEEMARAYKNDPSLRGGKLASDGTRVEDNLREKAEEELKENRMKSDIRHYLHMGNLSDEQFKAITPKRVLYFISFNILCHTETEYIPIEVGIAEYSLEYGIQNVFHNLIYPGLIPTGYAGDAKRISEDKHGIEIYGPEESSETDMTAVFNNIKSFITHENEDVLPPLFCQEEDIEQTQGCLYWLASRARSRDVFDVWNSKYLLLELRAGSGHALPSQTIAGDLLVRSNFDYIPEAKCQFHESRDNHNCALAYTKCLCYLMSDAICKLYGVALTEKHMPSQYAAEHGYVITKSTYQSRNRRAPVAPTNVRLDQRSNYYRNEVVENQSLGAEAPPAVSVPVVAQPNVPRQPATECIAAQMARLRVNMNAAAAVPGLGIGRGQRRNN